MHGKLHLVCDASEKAIGSCLNQFDPETQTWRPLAYYSKELSSSQRRYSTYDRELLALFLSVRHFCDLLLGRDVTLITDPILSGIITVLLFLSLFWSVVLTILAFKYFIPIEIAKIRDGKTYARSERVVADAELLPNSDNQL